MATRAGCVDIEPLVLTCPQAAKRLQISKSNCYSLIRAGELPHVRLRGRVLIPVKALNDWLTANATAGNGSGVKKVARNA